MGDEITDVLNSLFPPDSSPTNISEYLSLKKKNIISRSRSGLVVRQNGRSSDYVSPGFATGCELACSYCYVARGRSVGNPLEQYTNLTMIFDAIKNHAFTLPAKKLNPDQVDPYYFTYDIGESTDVMTPKNIQLTNWLIGKFNTLPNAKPTFATKVAGARSLIDVNSFNSTVPGVPRKNRVRVSLAPQSIVSKIEFGTSLISKRIEGIMELYDRGYEVHINFSPVVAYQGWVNDYINLFSEIDSKVTEEVKKQLKCEVIFLTHSHELHKKNMSWAPEAEGYLYNPEIQEDKITERGNKAIRYKFDTVKPKYVSKFKSLIDEHLPYCKIRYIF